MLKKIWRSIVKWFNNLVGAETGASNSPTDRSTAISTAFARPEDSSKEPIALEDADYEYLFMQLLEGVAHGWQQPRAVGFFSKIRHRIRKSDWISWLDRFGQNLLSSPVPNYELAGRMVQLSELECGEIGDIAGYYGIQLLNRQPSPESMEFLPMLDFAPESAQMLELDDRFDEDDRAETGYRYSQDFNANSEVGAGNSTPRPLGAPTSYSSTPAMDAEDSSEVKEITIEEFAMMLQQDSDLVAQLSQQLGLNTKDPQIVFDAVISQMQQQVQPISGDLSGELNRTKPIPKRVDRINPLEADPW
jgi:hypothetical protein